MQPDVSDRAPHDGHATFDEYGYLRANPDVAAAIAAGSFSSARQHHRMFGQAEGRPFHRRLSREAKLLGGLDLTRSRGAEIGPLMTPLVRKADGDIIYIDHADTESLRQKYACDPGADLSRIVPVDRVWGAQTLQECLGPGVSVDYVLASHVIEHVPDLVTWLAEVHAVLAADGALRLAIPDRRFTFDVLRTESTLADALDAWMRRTRIPLPRAILDHFLHYTEVGAADLWDGTIDPAKLIPKHAPALALAAARASFTHGTYQDTHCWVLTPLSFARLCSALAELGLLDFSCQAIYPTERHELEFIVALVPSADRSERAQSWTRAIARASLPVHGGSGPGAAQPPSR